MQIWIHDNKMRKITALNNDIPDMLSYTNSAWHSYLDQATSTFDFTIPKFSNGELHEDLKLINDECFVSFYVNGSYQVFYIATLQEDDFNIQLTCNNTNLEYALEYANPFNSSSAQSIQWYLEHMDLLSFASVEIGNNEISDRKRTLTFDSQETKMTRLQSLMSKFEAEFEFKVELNRDGTYKRIVINIYQENHIGTDRKDVVLYYSNGLKGVQVTSDKTQMFNAGVFDGKDGVNLANVEFSEKNADGVEEFYSRKGDIFVYAPLSMQRYPATMKPDGQDNWIRKDFQTEYENVNDLKAYALRTLKQYAYPLVTYTASVQSGFVSHYTDLKLGDTIRIIDKNFVYGLALEARVSEMIISFDNPANNSFVFTNYRKLDNKPSSALQTRIEQVIESRLPYRIELATTGGVTFKNNEGETIVKPSLYKGNLPWTKDVTWHWTLNNIVTDGMQYRIQARDITDTAVLTVDAFVGGKKVATTEITLTNVNDGPQGDEGPQGPQGDDGPKGDKGDTGNGIANTVVTYGLSVSDTTEPATWSSSVPTLVKGMYLWTRTVIIYTNGESTTSYQIGYIPQDGDASGEIDKTKQELLEKLETVRDDSLAAVEDAKQQLGAVRDESLAAAEEAKQQVTSVANDLSKTKTDFQNAVSAVDTKATNVQNDLSQAKQDLASQAQQLREQANAQSELTNRVSSVEETANGMKTSVSELSKTVAQNGKDITNVTARTKVVEDDLTSTKTTLSQVQTTADSASKKTATLETGLNGLSAKFETLKIGSRNYFKDSKSRIYYIDDRETQDVRTFIDDDFWQNDTRLTKDYVRMSFDIAFKPALPSDFTTNVHFGANPWYSCGGITFKGGTTDLQHFDLKFNLSGASKSYKTDNVFIRLHNTLPLNTAVSLENFNLYLSAVVEDYSSNEADIEQKIAEYKQTADQNYASLQSTVQNLDGTVQHNKTVAEQTAEGFKTRIESLETYKSGESTRANKYFELAKTETARQLSVERTAIAKDYVAKSTYTSDVTGIRNELSATTTTANTIKTNLANYQATNDRAVASLQSSMQTANGNISSLKTKVEAVPGQITSAVSAVESKIPTEIGSSNLLRNTAVNTDNLKRFEKSNSTISVVTKDGHQTYKIVVSANGSGVNFKGNAQYYNLIKERTYTFSFWVLTNKDKPYSFNSLGHIQAVNENGDIVGSDILHQHTNPVYSTNNIKANTWTKVWCTFKATSNSYFRPFFWYLRAGDEIYIYDMMLNEGNIPLSYTPAYEDTQSKITSLNTTLTQTADGLKQLSTQVTSQGSTITSHTNSINSLTTGLQAKVSQSDFNTLSGRVTTAENNITAKANELSSKITSVEGKIPTSVGGRNYIKDSEYRKVSIYVNDSQVQDEGFNISSAFWQNSNVYNKKIKLSFYYHPSVAYGTERKFQVYFRASPWPWIGEVTYPANTTRLIKYTFSMRNVLPANFTATQIFIRFNRNLDKGRYHNISKVMLEVSDVFSDWQPAPEDAIEEISSLSSELKQTQDGITLLATKTEVNSAKAELQSGIKTATDKANNNAQTISTHTTQISALNNGLSAKVSQSDFNTLSGRVTTAENNITAKANELSSKITSVEGKIPTSVGTVNLVKGTGSSFVMGYGITNTTWNETKKQSILDFSAPGVRRDIGREILPQGNKFFDFKPIKGTTYTQSIMIDTDATFNPNGQAQCSWFTSSGHNKQNAYIKKVGNRSYQIWSTCTWNLENTPLRAFDWYDLHNILLFRTSGTYLAFYKPKLTTGNLPSDWSPSPEDTAEQISSLSSEFKQTTDSIKASVTSLNNSTVKSSSLTINADGIVMKAGKSTTDVANAIGSYFAVNQNAINLFSDKINVKGNMIVAGAITGDKIAANSINSSKIVSSGITANVIKGGTLQSTNGSTNFELNTGKLFYNNNNTGVFRVQNGASTMGLKFSNTPITVSGTSRILSRAILGGDRNENTLDDGKWDKGGFSGIVIETIKGAIPAANEHADSLRAISDTIYFTHTYSADSPTGVSAHGWKMETYAPDSSYSGNIVLKPYGINYRQSDIVVGDIRLDNGDGSGYWMRATINTLKACFGHILNGGTSSQALNAIRSELNKISGT